MNDGTLAYSLVELFRPEVIGMISSMDWYPSSGTQREKASPARAVIPIGSNMKPKLKNLFLGLGLAIFWELVRLAARHEAISSLISLQCRLAISDKTIG